MPHLISLDASHSCRSFPSFSLLFVRFSCDLMTIFSVMFVCVYIYYHFFCFLSFVCGHLLSVFGLRLPCGFWITVYIGLLISNAFLYLFLATPVAQGSSQARDQIEVAAASLHHSQAAPDLRLICGLHHSLGQCWILNSLSQAKD